MELVVDNVAHCQGIAVGDGEFVSIDANLGPMLFPSEILSTSPNRLALTPRLPDALMERDPWLFVVAGRGVGQARRVVDIEPGGHEVEVWPGLTIEPDSDSRVLVTTAHSETHIVGNAVSNKDCPPKQDPGKKCSGGAISTIAAVTNVDITGNLMNDTSGIQVFTSQSKGGGRTQVAHNVRVRNNTVIGQFGVADPWDAPGFPDCSDDTVLPAPYPNGGIHVRYQISQLSETLPRLVTGLEIRKNQVCRSGTRYSLEPASIVAAYHKSEEVQQDHLGATGLVVDDNEWSALDEGATEASFAAGGNRGLLVDPPVSASVVTARLRELHC
jgi:hypothetical protein